jgi:hypothetical protein
MDSRQQWTGRGLATPPQNTRMENARLEESQLKVCGAPPRPAKLLAQRSLTCRAQLAASLLDVAAQGGQLSADQRAEVRAAL